MDTTPTIEQIRAAIEKHDSGAELTKEEILALIEFSRKALKVTTRNIRWTDDPRRSEPK